MNVENMRLVLQRLRSVPDEHFTMSYYFRRDKHWAPAVHASRWTCGTAACVAGHTIALLADESLFIDADWRTQVDVHEEARKLLGLTVEEAEWLFLAGWRASTAGGLETVTRAEATAAMTWFLENRRVSEHGTRPWEDSA